MIAYLKGKIVSISPTAVLLDMAGGIGMEVLITLSTYEKIKEQPECLLYTHLHIKKDGQMFSGYEMYGFYDIEDKHIYELIITVSGIGASTARLMLNALSANEIRNAILLEDERTISSIKGIGPKTAKRLILELKDKVIKSSDSELKVVPAQNNMKEEALLALISLGFQKNNVIKVLNSIDSKSEITSIEDYIKLALKSL